MKAKVHIKVCTRLLQIIISPTLGIFPVRQISMEFAKDVELQTPEFQTSTQENIAAYIDRVWNTAELLKDWGKSVCVLSAGNHDMVIANITTTVEYIQNVKFMLTNIMDSCCVHMIWLRNTTDIKDYPEHIQTKEKM